MSVVGLRLHNELKGIPSIAWEFEPPAKKNICTGRSFGSMISDKKLIQEAMSNYAATCALKLRNQKSAAQEIKVFVHTNPHRIQDEQYFRSVVIQFETATNSTPEIIKYALKGFEIIFKQGIKYMKCGVELRGFVPEENVQLNLFSQKDTTKNKKAVMALDKINKSLGKDLVRFGIQGFDKKFKARAAHLSPCYTTNIDQVIKVK